jgi:ribosomal protein S27AE
MPTNHSLEAAWRDLNRRSTILWLLFFGCIPGMLLLAYLLNDVLLQEASFFVVGLAWLGAIAWAGSRMASFACPRCSKAFFENWIFFKPLRQRCAHCSLTKWAKEMPPPAATGP